MSEGGGSRVYGVYIAEIRRAITGHLVVPPRKNVQIPFFKKFFLEKFYPNNHALYIIYMSHLICNIPNQKVWVRREYLRDLEDGHGEFVEGHWVTAKSIPGRAFYFETFLPEYGALFDKLPISAFVSSPETPDIDMALPDLQFWNCMDYGITCIQKQFIGSMDYEVWTKNHGRVKGSYIATLDNYHIHSDEVDYSTAEQPDEHKSFNLLELENGQFALYPNNRMRVYDNSLTPKNPKQPDFKVSTEYYQVENGNEYRLGDTEEYYYDLYADRDFITGEKKS